MNNGKAFRTAFSARNVAMLGVLLALVLILQMGLGSIVVGATSFSLVLVPIVLASVLIAPWAGALLGFVFSLVVYIYGAVGADIFTHVMIEANWFVTFIVCFSKGILAGFVPGLLYNAFQKNKDRVAYEVFDNEGKVVYRVIKKRDDIWGVVMASLSAPVVNTGLFVLGMIVFKNVFVDAFLGYGFITESATFFYFIIIICAGVNFLVEFGVNAVVIPALHTVIDVVEKRLKRV